MPNGNGRTPFPGNIIPANRINAGRPQHAELPAGADARRQQRQRRTSTARPRSTTARCMYTGKVDHKFTDKVSLSGLLPLQQDRRAVRQLLGARPQRPERVTPTRGDYILKRRVHMLALNNTWLPSNNTVLTLRYGLTKFLDDDTLSIDFDPAQLGFSSSVPQPDPGGEVPAGAAVTEYDDVGRHRPDAAATGTRGAPTAPTLEAARQAHAQGRRRLPPDRPRDAVVRRRRRRSSTSTATSPRRTRTPTALHGATPSGNALASLLLGYPPRWLGQPSRASTSIRRRRSTPTSTTSAATPRTTGASARS